MSDVVITGLFSLAGTFGGILTGNVLTNWRLKQLEAKVEKHNQLVERMYELETKVENLDERTKYLFARGEK